MHACSCPVCASGECELKLPMPLRYAHRGSMHWAWLTRANPLSMTVVAGDRVKEVNTVNKATQLALGRRTRDNAATLETVWTARVRGRGVVDLATLKELLPGGGVRVVPSVDESLSSLCFARIDPPPPRSSPRLQRPAKSPRLEEHVYSYTVASMGGDAERVRFIVDARPVWDQETVEELMRWGATPRLVRVHQVRETGHRIARCTFAQPDGRFVENVWLPLGDLRLDYPEHVRHLV